MNQTLKLALFGVAIACVSIGAYSQVDTYLERRQEEREAREELYKAVNEQTAGSQVLLETEVKSSSMTFGELFDSSNERVKKISETLILVQTAGIDDGERADLARYLEGLQEVLRLQVAHKRKMLAASSAADYLNEAVEELKSSSGYSAEFALGRAKKASSDAEKAAEEFQIAQNEYAQGIGKFQKEMLPIRAKIKSVNLISDELLSSVKKGIDGGVTDKDKPA